MSTSRGSTSEVTFQVNLPSVMSTKSPGASILPRRSSKPILRGSSKGSLGYPVHGRVLAPTILLNGAELGIFVQTDKVYHQFTDSQLGDYGEFVGNIYLDKNTPSAILLLKLRRGGQLIKEDALKCAVCFTWIDRLLA